MISASSTWKAEKWRWLGGRTGIKEKPHKHGGEDTGRYDVMW
jgi:hypothetical protein